MGSAWSFALARLAGLVALAVFGGLIFGYVQLWIIVVLAAYLTLQLTNLYRLERWLRHRSSQDPPDLAGIWGNVEALVTRIYRRKKFHKQRIMQLFREFRRLTAAMPEGVIVLNVEREILWFNRFAAEMLGLRRKVDFGNRVDNLVRHPDFVQYLEAGEFSGPVVIRNPRNNEKYLALQAVRYASGQQLLLVRDVTHQVRLESMRKDFVANASHELRSPLTVISGYLDTLGEDPGLDPAWSGPISEMRRQAERMGTIVNDLIELSKLEASTDEAEEEPADVPGMLALIRKEMLTFERRPRDLLLKLDSDALLLGSEAELHSVFSNLVANAIKYTPSDGTVEIRWWVDVLGAHLAVRDTGIGIASEHVPRLTERFYRVDPGRSRQEGGSGLGLAIVKHALQRHGATLQIESEEGRGSTFTCHFPPRRVLAREQLASA